MEPHHQHLQNLAELDAIVRAAEPDPDPVIEGAAGLLAGRIGGRIDQARARILQLAAEQMRTPRAVACELRAVLQDPARVGRDRPMGDDLSQAVTAPSIRRPQEPIVTTTDYHDDARIVQQMLNTGAGRHIYLMPVLDDAGQVRDFDVAAASPSVIDLAGRSGGQLVGRPLSELYPWLVDGPIWHAWQQTAADGRPRELGPLSYRAEVAGQQVALTITASAQPVGGGLLTTWTRLDEQDRLAERISQMERLGHLGWGEWDLVNDTTVWSDGMYTIFDRDPADGPLPRGTVEGWTLAADQPILDQAAQTFGRGETVDVVTRVRVGNHIKHLRTVADAIRDDNNRPLKLYGIVQDLTVQENNRARLVEVEQHLREHQRSLAAEHHLASQLQHIVLPIPARPWDLPGLRVAVRYLPAEQASSVGGDWFHAATARDGSVTLAVGDVSGHGVRAAATMAQLRHALTTLAVTVTAEPAELLSFLNELLYQGGLAAATATMVIARFDPASGALNWAQAGHPAPLRSRAGYTTQLPRPAGPLLGAVHEADYGTAHTTIAPGDVLLFYTDGLIERRHRPLLEGLAPIVATLNRITSQHRHQPLADLLAELHQANPEDDTCILVARRL